MTTPFRDRIALDVRDSEPDRASQSSTPPPTPTWITRPEVRAWFGND